jgi:hypothetical protein
MMRRPCTSRNRAAKDPSASCALTKRGLRAQSPHIADSVSLWKGTGPTATYLAFHEVDDVEHWLSSSKREEIFGPMGITARTFHDPEGSKRVGLIVEIPNMAAFQEFMQSEAAADA